MSGAQIGTIIGGAIGAYFGGPAGAQLGMAIGGAIGGAVDPTQINGPHIGDGQQQSATDGSPISWVMGTAKVAGTVVWAGERFEVKIKDSGKGGPEVSHYESRQSFAVCICESSELRGSTMGGVLMVAQDGVIVYDVRPGSTMVEDSLKWKENIDFMFGAEDQLPHPTIEAEVGADSTPAYRGRLMMVATDFDIYSAGDRIPNFEFTVSQGGANLWGAQSLWTYEIFAHNDTTDRSAIDYDDSRWKQGRAPFADLEGSYPDAPACDETFSDRAATEWPWSLREPALIWLRKHIQLGGVPPQGISVHVYMDDSFLMYVNGEQVWNASFYGGGCASKTLTADNSKLRSGDNVIAFVVRNSDSNPFRYWDSLCVSVDPTWQNTQTLAGVVAQISERGGLPAEVIDVSGLGDKEVLGYTVARQCTGADALRPLLQAYFCFGSEYDGQIHFHKFGEDASLTVDPAHLIVGNDATDGAMQETTRNQATEFPRKVIGRYTDPDQNYNVVTVMAERNAIDVIAIGEQQFDMPVVMTGDEARKAVDKALKVAYASLEGTREYAIPFAYDTTDYLAAFAGMPLLMDGKRWVLDDLTIGNNFLKFSTRYDRQSAYTSNLQAVKGVAPTPPVSRYGGPTELMAMNLPLLQSQDTVGVYVAVKGSNSGWRKADIQISYDDKETWQLAATANIASVFGTVVDALPSSGEPLVVDVGDGVLENATAGQLDGGANAFAVANGSTQGSVGQFQYADQDSLGDWELTGIADALKGSAALNPAAGDNFMMLENAVLIPIDSSYDGKTIWLRATANGEKADEQTPISIVYHADDVTYIDGGTPGDGLPPPASGDV